MSAHSSANFTGAYAFQWDDNAPGFGGGATGFDADVRVQHNALAAAFDAHTHNGSSLGLGVAGPSSFADGTAAAPSIAFANDTDVGLYRVSDGRIGFTIEGVQSHDFQANSFGIADSTASSAFLVLLAPTSSVTMTANRTITLDVGNVAHTLALGTTANTITFPNAASGTVPLLNLAQSFTAVQTFTATPVFQNASPLSLSNGQVATIALTSQTVGPVTLTIPDFASVADTFVFVTKAQTLASKTFTAPVLGVATGTSLAVTGLLTSSSASAGIGYAAGAGAAVTQGTNRTTTVICNAVAGAITLISAAGSTTPASFTVTNSSVVATDTIIVNQKSGTDLYEIFVTNVGAGSFKITSFTTGGTTTEQPVFNFSVIKSIAS